MRSFVSEAIFKSSLAFWKLNWASLIRHVDLLSRYSMFSFIVCHIVVLLAATNCISCISLPFCFRAACLLVVTLVCISIYAPINVKLLRWGGGQA